MRRRAIGGTALAALTLLAATACSAGIAAKAGQSARSPAPGSSAGDGDVRSAEVCEQVRQGIDAFNQGDFASTVDHFTQAVPLAHARVVADDTRANEQLLEAVVYYAELAPEDYLDAARSSPQFQAYKVITLGQCEGGTPATSPSPSSPGLDT